ncbi:hypothetical protein ACA910_009682 [Epithemia clementina (nom. ined.)]
MITCILLWKSRRRQEQVRLKLVPILLILSVVQLSVATTSSTSAKGLCRDRTAFCRLPGHSNSNPSLLLQQRQQRTSQPSVDTRNPNICFKSVSFAHRNADSSGGGGGEQADDDREIQWELFRKHHAKGSWKGIWTTYDYMGDVMDETIASVDLIPNHNGDGIDDDGDNNNVVTHLHQIVVGAKQSDCETCFDSMEIKTLPVATYTKESFAAARERASGGRRPMRLGACGMVIGPTVLRSGAMATELVLSHGDGRVRCIFQHAPVWERGTDPSSGAPPDGLKLFRAMISKEALRATPPTAASEAPFFSATTTSTATNNANPIFSRPVSPFAWHKQWAGTSWTWGPNTGNRGWQLQTLEEGDAWHGMAPVEVWNLRLPIGGIYVQTPRIMNSASIGLCRLAWLPTDDTLLRLEAGILAFQPVVDDDDDQQEEYMRFLPPSLASYRCDVLSNMGDLEGEPQFVQLERGSATASASATSSLEEEDEDVTTSSAPTNNTPKSDPEQPLSSSSTTETRATPVVETRPVNKKKDSFSEDDLKDARDALQL